MSSFFSFSGLRKRQAPQAESEENDRAGQSVPQPDSAYLSDGSLQYVVEKAGNDSGVSYQEASGAPVETESPLGYTVGPSTILFLNISKMIGTGVYSTRESSSLSRRLHGWCSY